MKLIRISVLMLFFVAILLNPLAAQEKPLKLGYINASKVFDSYNKTKDADDKLAKEAEKKNAERSKLVEEVNKLRDEIALLSEGEKKKKEARLSEKTRALQDFDNETKTSLQRQRNDIVKEIFQEIDGVIKDYGKKNGYDVIFDDRLMVYGSDALDVSDDIINTLNKGR